MWFIDTQIHTVFSSGSGELHSVSSFSMSSLAWETVPEDTSFVRSSSTNMSAITKESWWPITHFRGIFSIRKLMAVQLEEGRKLVLLFSVRRK